MGEFMLSSFAVTSLRSAAPRLTGALGLLLGLLAPVPLAAQPAGAGTRCDGAQAARLLDLPPREWQVACWRVEDGRQVIAAVPLAPLVPSTALFKPPTKASKTKEKEKAGPLTVRLGLARDQAVLWRGEVRPDLKATPELRELMEKSEEWLVAIDDQPLGRQRGVRVGVVGHWGTETMSVREIALLFRLPTDGGAMQLVWSGLGNTRESRLDYCTIEGIATFQLVDDHTLERQLRLTPTVNRDTPVPRAKARQLEKKCVAEPQEPRRFPVNPG
jgi:hypothetical protein